MSDIVELLRLDARPGHIEWEAADTIEALRKLVDMDLVQVIQEKNTEIARLEKLIYRMHEAAPFVDAYMLLAESEIKTIAKIVYAQEAAQGETK